MSVTVFTKPGCVQCNATYRALDKKGIEFTKTDTSQDAEALEYLREAGHMQMPVVEIRDEEGVLQDSWTGFNPDKIEALAA